MLLVFLSLYIYAQAAKITPTPSAGFDTFLETVNYVWSTRICRNS